jgi:hypothetical protein
MKDYIQFIHCTIQWCGEELVMLYLFDDYVSEMNL